MEERSEGDGRRAVRPDRRSRRTNEFSDVEV
jgi:hypothetical protein